MDNTMKNLYTKIYGQTKDTKQIEAFTNGFHCGVMYLYSMLYDGTITQKDITIEKLNQHKQIKS